MLSFKYLNKPQAEHCDFFHQCRRFRRLALAGLELEHGGRSVLDAGDGSAPLIAMLTNERTPSSHRMFFDTWRDLLKVVVAGTATYAFLVVLLRTSGKRTLSKLNAFDLIVTVALGSTLATIVLSRDVPLAEGITALLLLVVLQWLITWLSVRHAAVSNLVKSEPRLLLLDGRLLPSAMKRERVTEDELHAALRAQGLGRVSDAAAVVMETDGSLSVIPQREGSGPLDVLRHVVGGSVER